MVIKVLDIVPQCYSAEDGRAVYNALRAPLGRGETVVLSFAGVTSVTSSFVNNSLVALLEELTYAVLRERLVIRDTRPSVAALIRKRLAFEAERRVA